MADLYLVRHGQASLLGATYDQLSPVGETQSRLLGAWLVQCGYLPDAVATGTLSRQLRTAEICMETAQGPERSGWLQLPGLDEIETEEVLAASRPDLIDRGALREELSKAADPRRTFQTIYAAAIERWTSGAHDGDYELKWRDYRDGVLEAFRALVGLPARSVWAFTSGGPITAIVQHLLAIPDGKAFEVNWPLVNTGVTRIRFSASDGRASVSVLNAHPHLEQLRDASLTTFR